MYSSQAVANYFLDRAEEEGVALSQLKLLKLVYIAYGWIAAFTDTKLFEDEIEAWTHGPVVPSLYHEFKHFGSGPIVGRSVAFDLESEDFETTPRISQSDDTTMLVLNYVWGIYKNVSAWSLRELTHKPKTPWSTVYGQDGKGAEIPFALITQHFKTKIQEYLVESGEGKSEQSVA